MSRVRMFACDVCVRNAPSRIDAHDLIYARLYEFVKLAHDTLPVMSER